MWLDYKLLFIFFEPKLFLIIIKGNNIEKIIKIRKVKLNYRFLSLMLLLWLFWTKFLKVMQKYCMIKIDEKEFDVEFGLLNCIYHLYLM